MAEECGKRGRLCAFAVPAAASRDIVRVRERALTRACIAGDARAYGRLLDASYGRVFRSVAALIHQREDAEDVTLEALTVAWEKLPSFRGDCAFATWVAAIARNLARRRLRLKRPELVPLEWEVPDGRCDDVDLRIELRGAMDDLPPSQRAVVELCVWEEYSSTEAAARLGCPDATVRSRLCRGLARLRQALAEEHDEGGSGQA